MTVVPEYTSDDKGYYYKVPGKSKQGPFKDLRHAMDEYQASLVPQPTEPKKGSKKNDGNDTSGSGGLIADSAGSAGESAGQEADGGRSS